MTECERNLNYNIRAGQSSKLSRNIFWDKYNKRSNSCVIGFPNEIEFFKKLQKIVTKLTKSHNK